MYKIIKMLSDGLTNIFGRIIYWPRPIKAVIIIPLMVIYLTVVAILVAIWMTYGKIRYKVPFKESFNTFWTACIEGTRNPTI